MVFLVFFSPEYFLKVSQKSNKPTHSIFCDISEWAKNQKVARFGLYLTFSKTNRDQINLKIVVFRTVVIKTYKNLFDSKLADWIKTKFCHILVFN
jgi:hypothetical protein